MSRGAWPLDERGRSDLVGRMGIVFARSLGSFASCQFSLCALYHTFPLMKHEMGNWAFLISESSGLPIAVVRRLKY